MGGELSWFMDIEIREEELKEMIVFHENNIILICFCFYVLLAQFVVFFIWYENWNLL